MNKVILMGRLTKDPEVRYTQGDEPTAIARYTLAVNRTFKKEGEPDADFITCVAFAKKGEFAEKYFKKGQMVAVCGRLSIRTYDDQNNQRHWMTEVIVDDQYFAESKASFESRMQSMPPEMPYQGQPAKGKPQNAQPDGFFAIDQELDDEDLPF